MLVEKTTRQEQEETSTYIFSRISLLGKAHTTKSSKQLHSILFAEYEESLA
jgi:hypothetical protein